MDEQHLMKGIPTEIRFPGGFEEQKEYGIDPRLLTWIKNNLERCPQTLDDFARITRLDRWKVNRSKSTSGYETPSWLVERRGDFSLIGKMRDLEYLRLQEIELEDFSFLTRCKKLQMLDLQHTNFTDCRLLAELPELKKAYLPPRSQMVHTEILDTLLKKKAEPLEIEVPEPFYKDEDFQNLKIVDGGTVRLSYEGSSQVRCVGVDFAGKYPSAWKDFPQEEEDCWVRLSEESKERMADQLADAILKGKVHSFLLSQEPWGEGHFLSAEFAGGWAALFYEDDEGNCYSSYNDDYDTVEILSPVEVGGQSPVPKMMALEDMELVARITKHFLRTGQLCPGTFWVTEGEDEVREDEMTQAEPGESFITYCGIEIVPEENGCFTRAKVEPKHYNPYGIVHGGLLYTMADTAAGYTARMLTQSPVTLNSEFHYMKNTAAGVLTARTEILKAGRHILLLRVRVLADEELLLAEGTFTYYSDGKDHDVHGRSEGRKNQ